MAYSTIQPCLNHFVEPNVGYVAYFTVRRSFLAPRGRRIVVASPVCAPEKEELLLRKFLAEERATVFLQILDKTANILRNMGLRVAAFGVESEVDLQQFDFSLPGKQFASLRRLRNKGRREQIRVFERHICRMRRDENEESAVKNLSRSWLRRRGGKEYALLTRPLMLQDKDDDVRYFWAKKHGTLFALMVFDPMYREGRRIGYFQNHIRYRPDVPHGTTDALTLTAMQVFHDEGHMRFSFGLSPLAAAPVKGLDYENAGSRLSCLLQALRRRGEFLYSFEGNEFFKRRYNPEVRPVFVATTEEGTVVEMLSVLRAMRQLSLAQVHHWAGVFREYRRLLARNRAGGPLRAEPHDSDGIVERPGAAPVAKTWASKATSRPFGE